MISEMPSIVPVASKTIKYEGETLGGGDKKEKSIIKNDNQHELEVSMKEMLDILEDSI